MSAIARRLYVRPDDPTQRYVLWSNGYIQAIGGALAIDLDDWQTAVGSGKSPTFYGSAAPGPVMALAIVDWDTPKGYTLDMWGHVYPWGGATAVPGGTAPYTDGPEYLFGLNGGVARPTYGYVADFAMDPAGNGRGYLLLYDGDVIAIGTGVTAVTHSAFIPNPGARRIAFNWSTHHYLVFDGNGRVWESSGANPSVDGIASPGWVWGWGGPLVTPGGFALYDLSTTPLGWTLDAFGRAYRVGSADDPLGYHFTPAARQWTDLGIVDDGTGANPLRLVAMTTAGTFHEWVVSTAPTATVVTPSDPTTDTTRPYVTWDYVDDEGDAQAAYSVKVFDSATYGGGGFDPDTSTAVFSSSGTDPNTRRVQITTDLANDDYRAYVKVTDTSELSSSWAYAEWTQNVTAPATPTVTATAGATELDGITLDLHVTPSGLDPDARFAVQFTDDGATWALVRDGYNITPDGSGDATLVDLEAPFGAARTYRSIVYIYDATSDTWAASDWSATDAATLPSSDVWALTNPYDADQGGEVILSAAFTLNEDTIAGRFIGANRADPVVVSDGAPKYPTGSLSWWALTAADRVAWQELLDADVTLLLRDPLGAVRYVRRTGAVTVTPLETTPTRETHEYAVVVQQVRRPDAGPASGPLAES